LLRENTENAQILYVNSTALSIYVLINFTHGYFLQKTRLRTFQPTVTGAPTSTMSPPTVNQVMPTSTTFLPLPNRPQIFSLFWRLHLMNCSMLMYLNQEP